MADKPPALFILADAAADMAISSQAGLDDILAKEIERLNTRGKRLQAMLEAVTAVVGDLKQIPREVIQDARGDLAEDFEPEEL